jgi:hypothetical protein
VRHLRIVNSECRPLGITVRNLNLSIDSRGRSEFEHYLFRFRRYLRDDSAALRFVEALVFGFSIVASPFADLADPLVLRIPDALVRERHSIPLQTLIALEESRPWGERSIRYPRTHIAGGARTMTQKHEMAWRIATVTFRYPALFDATRFLHRSYESFCVSPGEIREVLSDPDKVPKTGAVQNNFEDALQSAFKAVEAVIGDPPKDDRRFHAKLAELGLDPKEEVGYVERIPFERMIRRMNEARDRRSAHGSTRNRRISATELLDFQTCAEIIVVTALEKVRGRPLET